MARLVLLSFKDNAEAERLAQNLTENEGDISTVIPCTAHIEWVIAQPTKACQCGLSEQPVKRSRRRKGLNRTSADAFSKGRRFGWWCHATCHRVSRGVLERFVANLTNGNYDLLPEILDDPERVPNDMRRFHDFMPNIRSKR